MPPPETIFKILLRSEWQLAQSQGVFDGSEVDVADGFIHFSTASQLDETLRRYFAGQTNLVILEVDAASLANNLRWEPSRDGDLFPHLYGALPTTAVTKVSEI